MRNEIDCNCRRFETLSLEKWYSLVPKPQEDCQTLSQMKINWFKSDKLKFGALGEGIFLDLIVRNGQNAFLVSLSV